MIKIEKITNTSKFEALKEDWNDLLDKSNAEDITLTWEWLFTWWSVYKNLSQLYILVLRENNNIVGIAPLLKRKVCYFGILTFNRIEPLAANEQDEIQVCSDYLDFIIVKGREEELVPKILDYLIDDSDQWDELNFEDFIETSKNTQSLMKYFEKNNTFSSQIMSRTPCPYVELPSKWDHLMKAASRNFRQSLNKKKRRLLKEGEVEYNSVSKKQDFKEGFNLIKDLHQNRWKSKGEPGSFKSKKFTLFHEKIFSLFIPLDRVKLYFLKVNGKYVTGRYCFNYKDKVYDYLTGLNDTTNTNASPGFLLLAYCIEDAIALGKKRFDFFKGASPSYKHQWTDKVSYVTTIRISFDKHFKNKIYKQLLNLKKIVKKIIKGTK